jgi:DNA replication and repair protein RecF
MISDIRLQHFRSYEDATFEFGPGVNIIVGPNGSGKTNLLEALQILAIGRSYRVQDAELLQFDEPWFRLDSHLDDGAYTRVVKFVTTPRQYKTFELDGVTHRSLAFEHTTPIVLFEPNNLFLLHGAPELRRAYLDDILEQIQPGYATFRKHYKRALAQRNALLKKGIPSPQEIFPWDLRLSELGAVISRSRAGLVTQLSESLRDLYTTISHTNKNVQLHYETGFPTESYETHMLQKLESALSRDIARGFTAYGPHREDMSVTFDGHPAEEVASRGEIRTVVLALKIIELGIIEKVRGKTPLLLLDDVFSELDGTRRRALTDYLQRYQTFLTTTDADLVVKHFTTSTILPLV